MEIRNFCIISHVDHGKSTLADRFLEMTGAISSRKMRPQFLDMMELEREKGITIKMQPIRMSYKNYILNLIDTPGHVDFSYEVSRSLAAVEGAILLVDAGKGIQAQTLANLELARRQKIVIIPVINKIDLVQAETEKAGRELAGLLGVQESEVVKISAKLGTNVERVLRAVIEKIPAPKKENLKKPFRALIFDSLYDSYKGVIAYVRVVDGEINNSEKIELLAGQTSSEIKELGYFAPEFSAQKKISAGEIGYIATGVKEPGKVRVGDTIVKKSETGSLSLSGYREPQPMLFASFYPEKAADFDLLKDSLFKLKLNDPSLVFEPESKEQLGRGFRCGFLGALHVEIVSERLRREFGLNLIISRPSVVYKIIDLNDKEKFVYSPSDWPEQSKIKESREPWARTEIITPAKYLGRLMEIFKSINSLYLETKYLSPERLMLIYETPLKEIIVNLYDKIKGASQGFASFNYRFLEYRKAELLKMEVLIAGKLEPAFSRIVAKDKIYQEGKNLVLKLKDVLPAQQFNLALQAVVAGKVVARETVRARRKNVTGYLYGGDYSRKRKLLEKQKKGKKILKERGRVKIDQKTFLEIFRT